MATPIVPVPDTVLASEFPSNADREAGLWNQKAKNWADSENAMSVRNREIAVTAHTNALAAKEQAQAAAEQAQLAHTNGAAQVALATGQAVRAEAAAATALGAAAYAGVWSELSGPLTTPASVYHAGKYWGLLHDIADVAAHEPGVSPEWGRASTSIDYVAYDDRGSLRDETPSDGDLALVEGLGLFRHHADSDEPDDDESCFATSTGRWLLECPHWDVVTNWQLPDDMVRDESGEDAAAGIAAVDGRWPGRILFGTALCAITNVAATASAAFTGTVSGAEVGDHVMITPPAMLGDTDANSGRLAYHAYVSAADTVTVRLANPSAATANINSAVRTAWPIIVIKES